MTGSPLPLAGSRAGDSHLRLRQKPRLCEPVPVGVIREDRRAAPDRVDQLLRHLGAHRRTSPASAEPAERSDGNRAHVIRAVHHDGSIPGVVVHAVLEAAKAKRVTIAPEVGVRRDEQAETGGEAAVAIGEDRRNVAAAVLAVSNQLAVEELTLLEIKHKKAGLRRRNRMIDDREKVAALEQTLLTGARRGVEREAKNIRLQSRSLSDQIRNGRF